MNGRGQAPLALAFVAVVVLAVLGADSIGASTPEEAPASSLASARWICPHGGGEGWTGSVVVMNPGDEDVEVRISTVGATKRTVTDRATAPAGRQLVHEVPVSDRGAATIVDAFGSWVGVAWLLSSEDPAGLGAEPCLPSGARRWYAGDPGTPKGENAFLVVTNPYELDAIVDVALFTAERAPIRPKDWSDLEVGAGRSVALPVNRAAEGEEAVLAQVTAEVGRIAVASLVMGGEAGIRSAVATPMTAGPVQHLPLAGGEGDAEMLIGVPTSSEARFAEALFSARSPLEGGLTEGVQAGPSSMRYEIVTAREASSVSVEVDEGTTLVATLRAVGRATDDGATSGTSRTASSWVVPSTYLGGQPWFPSLVLVNPGSRDAAVTLTHLPGAEGVAGEPVVVSVPSRTVATAPEGFLEAAPRAAVVVHAEGGEVVALGASTSQGIEGFARYALVLGVPLPPDAG